MTTSIPAVQLHWREEETAVNLSTGRSNFSPCDIQTSPPKPVLQLASQYPSFQYRLAHRDPAEVEAHFPLVWTVLERYPRVSRKPLSFSSLKRARYIRIELLMGGSPTASPLLA